jgi:hypothetical protein
MKRSSVEIDTSRNSPLACTIHIKDKFDLLIFIAGAPAARRPPRPDQA